MNYRWLDGSITQRIAMVYLILCLFFIVPLLNGTEIHNNNSLTLTNDNYLTQKYNTIINAEGPTLDLYMQDVASAFGTQQTADQELEKFHRTNNMDHFKHAMKHYCSAVHSLCIAGRSGIPNVYRLLGDTARHLAQEAKQYEARYNSATVHQSIVNNFSKVPYHQRIKNNLLYTEKEYFGALYKIAYGKATHNMDEYTQGISQLFTVYETLKALQSSSSFSGSKRTLSLPHYYGANIFLLTQIHNSLENIMDTNGIIVDGSINHRHIDLLCDNEQQAYIHHNAMQQQQKNHKLYKDIQHLHKKHRISPYKLFNK